MKIGQFDANFDRHHCRKNLILQRRFKLSKILPTPCHSWTFSLLPKRFQILALKLLDIMSSKTDKGPPMLGRNRLLILIPAILLIPILFGMTPLNMAHRLANGGPFTHCKQVQWNNHCPFNSLVSHGDPIIIGLNSTPVDQESTPTFRIQVLALNFTHSNISTNSVPLRC